MSASVMAARKTLERELRSAEREVERLKKAVRALAALENPRNTGKRLPNKGQRLNCKAHGCGRPFIGRRSDAQFCPDCRGRRHAKAVTKSAKKKPTVLSRNTPTASKK